MDVRTEGELVSETGHRFTRLMLTPQQLDLLHHPPPFVYLTGPPGTGKTVLLYLRALDWLRAAHHVHVVSTHARSVAATCCLAAQLRRSFTSSSSSSGGGGEVPERVHVHLYDLWGGGPGAGVEAAVGGVMETAARAGHEQGASSSLRVVMDEPWVGR